MVRPARATVAPRSTSDADFAIRQGAIDRITRLSGFAPDPADVPASLGAAVLDILTRPRS